MEGELDRRIFDKTAADLAAMAEPDLTGFDDDDVVRAVARTTGREPGQRWSDELRRRVAHESLYQVRLEEADPEEFPFRIKQFGATYHRLIGPSGTRLVVIGPFARPVRFVL
ncbi:hypothetical protein [Streptomyces sp. NPDC006997]|uniref:hypothetical protein n=1 Tax=Streptomyces sp. NPDC006997 TaxID=3155356 RepID=UPI0034084E92